MITSLTDFATTLHQRILYASGNEEHDETQLDFFSQIFAEHLLDAGEFEEDPSIIFHKAKGIQLNGYFLSPTYERLDLIISEYSQENELTTLQPAKAQESLKRLLNFAESSFGGLHKKLEEASPIYDAAETLYSAKNSGSLAEIRLFLLTNSQIKKLHSYESTEIDKIKVSRHVWDIERLHKCVSSGEKREIIALDLTEVPLKPIPCICPPSENSVYDSYLGVFPGEWLANLYDIYGPRLLERNVRSYLHAKGKVNKGLQNSIREEPEMFLAYNNGISATAQEAVVVIGDNGVPEIQKLVDFQIVNGAQTTASLSATRKKFKADLSKIFIQFKLSVLRNKDRMDEVVPKISEYANSQNKVQAADFSANDPYHRELEQLSRTTWTPAREGETVLTRWYYERARGQFVDEKSKGFTKARMNNFLRQNPKSQMFTKTDLAKFVNSWDQRPDIVSKGAQANFRHFTITLQEYKGPTGKGIIPTQQDFEDVVSKAILFRETEKIVSAKNFGGYRANIVAYTIAWLARLTQSRINFKLIWSHQGLSEALSSQIEELCVQVHSHITDTSQGANVTQWCKKKACWDRLKEKNSAISKELTEELLKFGPKKADRPDQPSPDPIENLGPIDEVMSVSSDKWKQISSWAKEMKKLNGFQRSLSFNIGKMIKQGKAPSLKQAIQAVKVLNEVKRLGFPIEE